MTPKSLPIFVKKPGIHIPNEYLILLVLGAIALFLTFLEHAFGYDLYTFSILFWFLFIGCFAVLGIANFFRTEKAIGEFKGALIFEQTHIAIEDTVYSLSQIQKIVLDGFDIKGSFMNSSSSFLTPMKSSGLNNTLSLALFNGSTVSCHFLQTETNRLSHFRELFIHYYKKGKLGWLPLLDILEIARYEDIQRFKKEIR